MKHVFPTPLLSSAVLALWLLINNTLHPAHIVLGLLLALAIPLATQPLRTQGARLRKPLALLRLMLVVLWDILVSNIEVARRILGSESRIQPCFFWVPLDIRQPYGIAMLAGIITLTPGTLSADLSADRRHLLVHALNAPDVAAAIATIKRRYEVPLMEIFP